MAMPGGERTEDDDEKQSRAALKQLNAELERRVAQRTQELEKVCRELTLAHQELESFTEAASHDLRSPLSSIGGMAGLLQLELAEGRRDTAQQRLDRIQDGVRRMAEIIDGLLTLARVISLDGESETVDLGAIAESIAGDLRRQYPEHPVTTVFESGLEVQGDPRMLRTLLANLLDNAWKYSVHATDPRVEFKRVGLPEGAGEYVLTDNGAGFDMRYVDRLFKPFRRLHSAQEFSGLGLGLAAVARIVRRYGGEVRAESTAEQGTTVSFTLPAAERITSSVAIAVSAAGRT